MMNFAINANYIFVTRVEVIGVAKMVQFLQSDSLKGKRGILTHRTDQGI